LRGEEEEDEEEEEEEELSETKWDSRAAYSSEQ
jgi:hypothetical protein